MHCRHRQAGPCRPRRETRLRRFEVAMPTIGQLPPASSVSDTDLLAIYQNSQTLAATRAQLLAGMQKALTLPQNTLLGNAGAGTAGPSPITIGANLALTGSTLSATAVPFQIPT